MTYQLGGMAEDEIETTDARQIALKKVGIFVGQCTEDGATD